MSKYTHSKDFPDCFHRVAVKGLCVQDGKIFFMKESDKKSGKWMLPGGGLDFGENIQEALIREIEEEMKLTVTSVSTQPVYSWTSLFEGERGMDWYYSLVLAYKIELADCDFTPSEDCVEVSFFSLEELATLDIYHQSTGLKKVFNSADFQ